MLEKENSQRLDPDPHVAGTSLPSCVASAVSQSILCMRSITLPCAGYLVTLSVNNNLKTQWFIHELGKHAETGQI